MHQIYDLKIQDAVLQLHVELLVGLIVLPCTQKHFNNWYCTRSDAVSQAAAIVRAEHHSKTSYQQPICRLGRLIFLENKILGKRSNE